MALNPGFRTDEPYVSLGRVLGMRWYMNRIENLLLMFFAKNPSPADKEKYQAVWRILSECESSLTEAYRSISGCQGDPDCFDDWVCDSGFCRPPHGNGAARLNQV